jgi:hypothetical protein
MAHKTLANALRAAGYGLSNGWLCALLKMTGPTTPRRDGAGDAADAVGEPVGSAAADATGQATAPPIRSTAAAAAT